MPRDAAGGWSDSRIVEALDTGVSMVCRVRRQLVDEGFAAVLACDSTIGRALEKTRCNPIAANIG